MNNVVDLLHSKNIDRLSCDSFILKSVDSLANQNLSALYPPEFIHSINLSGVPQHDMSLKVNTSIMLMRNLNPRNGHCNGTRDILTKVTDRLIEARMLGGERAGSILLIRRILIFPSDMDLPFKLRR